MKRFIDRKKTPSLRKRLICGTVASFIAQGCNEDLTPLATDEFKIVQGVEQVGNEFLYPVLERMAEAADDHALFGMDGTEGSESFLDDLRRSKQQLSVIVEAGQIYKFNDSEYQAKAFYRDRDIVGADLIGVNTAFATFFPLDQHYDCQISGVTPLGYGDLLHEASHERFKHSNEVDTYVASDDYQSGDSEEEVAEKLVVEQEDFSFEISFGLEDLEGLFRNHVVHTSELYSRFDAAKASFEGDPSETNRQNYIELLDVLSTPEGWASLIVDENELTFFGDFWGVPLEERQRIVAESGWYEEFIEDEIKEVISEARRELAQEGVREKEPLSEETLDLR